MLDASKLVELIETAREEYAGVTMHMPSEHYDRQRYGMHPSELGLCDLKSALQASGLPRDYEIDNEWLMSHGNYVAPMIQLPLMHYAMKHLGVAFSPEHIVEGAAEYDGYSTQPYQGKLDGLLMVDGQSYVVEIKDTEGMVKRSIGEPSLRYCLQVLAYKLLIAGDHNPAFIITCSKWGYSVYELRWVGNGFMVYDQWGKAYMPPAYMGDWNNPTNLNYVEVIKRINKKQALIDNVRAATGRWQTDVIKFLVEDNKIADPLTDKEKGWLCVWHYDKATKTRGGEARPNCPFAQRCHGLENRVYTTQKTDGGGYEFEVGS